MLWTMGLGTELSLWEMLKNSLLQVEFACRVSTDGVGPLHPSACFPTNWGGARLEVVIEDVMRSFGDCLVISREQYLIGLQP